MRLDDTAEAVRFPFNSIKKTHRPSVRPVGIDRVTVPGGKIERIADLSKFQTEGVYGFWFGLTPDDTPLLLKDAGSQEIVSMAWNAP